MAFTETEVSQDHWKLYWMMSDLKWHGCELKPIVPALSEALIEVKNDPHG
jgi:hypothetical protein